MKKIVKKILAQYYRWMIVLCDRFSKRKIDVPIGDYQKEIDNLFTPPEYKCDKGLNYREETLDLSIIIPVYNGEKYLKECLDSIFNNKTKYEYEVIVIDDGSSDSSMKILQSYSKDNLIIKSQTNQGAAAARNQGLDLARGEYVAFIDSDDYISDDYIEKLVCEGKEKKADVVKCGYYRVYDRQKISFTRESYFIQKDTIKKKLLVDGFICIGIMKRKLFANIRFPNGYWYEDMIARPLIYTQVQSISFLSECMYFYRQHTSNITKKVESSTNYQCLCQFYLPRYIIEYARDIKIPIDDFFKTIMLNELSFISYMRFRKLPLDIQKCLFYLNAEFIRQLDLRKVHELSKMEKYFLKAFLDNNFQMYRFIAKYNKFK